jgi:hypothetical protein
MALYKKAKNMKRHKRQVGRRTKGTKTVITTTEIPPFKLHTLICRLYPAGLIAAIGTFLYRAITAHSFIDFFSEIKPFMALFLIVFVAYMFIEVSRVKKENYGIISFVLDLIEMVLFFAAFLELGFAYKDYSGSMSNFYSYLAPVPILVNVWNLSVKIRDIPFWILGIVFSSFLVACAIFSDCWKHTNITMLIVSTIGLIIFIKLND